MRKRYLPFMLSVVPAILMLTACGPGAPAITPIPSTETLIPATPTNTPIPFTATPDISFRRIGLREFAANNIILDILEFDIPQDYSAINLFDPPFLGTVSPYALSVWIPTEHVDSYTSGVSLPADSGLFYIKISDNVIYDDTTDTFSGWSFTDQEIKDREAEGSFITFQEQRQIGEFPILIVEESVPPDDQGRTRYKYLYIETVVAETIGIIYSISATNIEQDEFVWKKLIDTLSVKK